MRIQIEPIPFGLDDKIELIELQWGNKGVFDDNLSLIILQFNTYNNLIGEKKIVMSVDEYMALGENKENRISAILDNIGINRI